jgi:hypothetical protein
MSIKQNKTKQSNLLHRYRQGLKIPFDAIPIYISVAQEESIYIICS